MKSWPWRRRVSSSSLTRSLGSRRRQEYRRGLEAAKAVWTSRRLQRALLDRTRARNLGGELAATVNLMSCALAPTFLFIALRDGGPSARRTAGRPDQGADQGPNWPLGQLMEINLTFFPLISPYDLNLTYFIFFPFHYRSVHKACLIIMVSAIRLTATMHLSVLKQILN